MNTEDAIQNNIEQDRIRGVDWDGVGVIDTRPVVTSWKRDRNYKAPWTRWQKVSVVILAVIMGLISYTWYWLLK